AFALAEHGPGRRGHLAGAGTARDSPVVTRVVTPKGDRYPDGAQRGVQTVRELDQVVVGDADNGRGRHAGSRMLRRGGGIGGRSQVTDRPGTRGHGPRILRGGKPACRMRELLLTTFAPAGKS